MGEGYSQGSVNLGEMSWSLGKRKLAYSLKKEMGKGPAKTWWGEEGVERAHDESPTF